MYYLQTRSATIDAIITAQRLRYLFLETYFILGKQ